MQKIGLPYSLFVFLTIFLVSCGLSQEKKETEKTIGKPRTAAQILGDTNYLAICYGGYRTNSRDSQPTIAQIKDDLKILHATGIKLLRTYNTQYAEASNLLQAIKEIQTEDANFEMYVMLGAWIDCKNQALLLLLR